MNIDKEKNWSGGIFDVFNTNGRSYIKINDYINIASTCQSARRILVNEYHEKIFKNIFLMSARPFRSFMQKAQAIDRTSAPKFSSPHRGPDIAPYERPNLQSQNEYEIDILNNAYPTRYALPYDLSFHSMSDSNRNKLLDVINEIDSSELISSTDIENLSTCSLVELHSRILKSHPQLDTLFLLFNKKAAEPMFNITKWDCLMLLFLVVVLIGYGLFYRGLQALV